MATADPENASVRESIKGDQSVDWKGRPCKGSRGGKRAAIFVLGIQAFEIISVAAVGNNLITYVFNEMHFSLPKSANVVTNFVGTIFLLSLLGGFLSDSYIGSFWTIIIFGFVELSGFILLSVQAHMPQLRPPDCNMRIEGDLCQEARGFQALMFYLALYLVALGSGCLKPNMISHGADQFSEDDPDQAKKLSSYFNAAYFSFSLGELIALTVLVWVQTHSGMGLGFGISAATMAIGLVSVLCGTPFYRNKPPQGSIFTPIAQVLVAAFTKRKSVCSSKQELHGNTNEAPSLGSSTAILRLLPTERFRFLDKACTITEGGTTRKESPWRLCTVTQVEKVKILISVTPIFACTIIFNTILAQLQTMSVQQGSAMDNQLTKNFKVPPASLQSIPYICLMFVVPLYESLFVPFARKITGKDSGITPLQRIGAGLCVATLSMVTAALVEYKRRRMATLSNHIISIFWIAPQYLIFGLSEMFTAVGLIEFFYQQSVTGMQAFLTAMTYCSYSFGFFFSSILVSVVNKVSSSGQSERGWLSNNDLNKDRLDLFYWLLAALSLVNFFQYLFWSKWFAYNPVLDPNKKQNLSVEERKLNSSKHIREEDAL